MTDAGSNKRLVLVAMIFAVALIALPGGPVTDVVGGDAAGGGDGRAGARGAGDSPP